MSDEPSSDIQESVNKQAQLAEARSIMVRHDFPPIFIDRVIDLVEQNCTAEEIANSQVPRLPQSIGYVLAFGVLLPSVFLTAFIGDTTEPIILVALMILASLPGLLAAVWMTQRFMRDKRSIENDANAFLARVFLLESPVTGALSGGVRLGANARRRAANSVLDVDKFLRAYGWRSVAGVHVGVIAYALVMAGAIVIGLDLWPFDSGS